MNCKCGHVSARHTNGYCQACPSRCRQFEASVDGLERTLVTPIKTYDEKIYSVRVPDHGSNVFEAGGKKYIIDGDSKTIVPAEQSEIYQKYIQKQIESYSESSRPRSWFDKIAGSAFTIGLLIVLVGPVSSAISESAKLYSPENSSVQTVLGIIPLMAAVVVLLSIVGIVGGDK
jgi:hypothetical protein